MIQKRENGQLKDRKKQLLRQIWAFCLMESWLYIWDDLLRLFTIARVTNPKTGFYLVTNFNNWSFITLKKQIDDAY